MTKPTELTIIYNHRPPVIVSAPDAFALYLYLMTPMAVRYSEIKRALSSELEETQAA